MRTRFLLFISLFLSLQFVHAQDARSILDKASATYAKAGGVKANFTLISTTNDKKTFTQQGTALMKGDKFRIEFTEGITWFDGTTQWVYSKDGQEINVSTPSGTDLAGISPAFILNMYKVGFVLKYKGIKKMNGKSLYLVEMIPEKKGEYKKLTLAIDQKTNLFSIVTLVNESATSSLVINRLETGVDLPESTFTFDKTQYPKAEVIDLR